MVSISTSFSGGSGSVVSKETDYFQTLCDFLQSLIQVLGQLAYLECGYNRVLPYSSKLIIH